MSADAVGVVRSVLARWGDGEFRTEDLLHPDVVFVLGPGFPDAGTYTGVDEVTKYTIQFLEPWVRVKIELVEAIDAGEAVLTEVRQHAVGRESGVPSEFNYFIVWDVADGKVRRWENFRERADALAAAGLA